MKSALKPFAHPLESLLEPANESEHFSLSALRQCRPELLEEYDSDYLERIKQNPEHILRDL